MIRRYDFIRDAHLIDGAAIATLIRGDDYVTPGDYAYTDNGRNPVSFVATIASLYGVPMVDFLEYNGSPCGSVVALGFPVTSWPMRDALMAVQRLEYAVRDDGSRYTWSQLCDALSAFYGEYSALAGDRQNYGGPLPRPTADDRRTRIVAKDRPTAADNADLDAFEAEVKGLFG